MLFRHRFLKRSMDLRKRPFLRIDVEAGRAGLRNQQCARAIGGEPDAVALVRPALTLQPVDQLQHLAGRIARQQFANQHAGRRIQQIELSIEPAPDAGRRKALGRDRRAEQIAVAQQELAIGQQALVCAVGYVNELFVFFQARRQRPAQRGELGLFLSFDTNQHQARHHAVTQFVDEEALGRRRRTGQKGGKIGAVLRSRDDHCTH